MKTYEDYGNLAREYFESGYNCCQSVVLAFSDLLDMDRESLAKLCSGFGAGMGKLREVCGAVSGAFMVTSMLKGYSSPMDAEGKSQTYALIHSLADEIKEHTGSIICRELLGKGDDGSSEPSKRTAEYYKKRPCGELCALCAEILARKIL